MAARFQHLLRSVAHQLECPQPLVAGQRSRPDHAGAANSASRAAVCRRASRPAVAPRCGQRAPRELAGTVLPDQQALWAWPDCYDPISEPPRALQNRCFVPRLDLGQLYVELQLTVLGEPSALRLPRSIRQGL